MAILFTTFLCENSTYRTNNVYHDIANGKCYVIDTEKIFLDPSQGVQFPIQNCPFSLFQKNSKNLKNLDFVLGITPLVSIAWHFPSALSWNTFFFMQALFSFRNLGNNIACFQSFSKKTQSGPEKRSFFGIFETPPVAKRHYSGARWLS